MKRRFGLSVTVCTFALATILLESPANAQEEKGWFPFNPPNAFPGK